MSEEEINDNLLMLKHFIELEKEENWQNYSKSIQGLLDLYQKEKETSHFLQSELDQANAKILELLEERD